MYSLINLSRVGCILDLIRNAYTDRPTHLRYAFFIRYIFFNNNQKCIEMHKGLYMNFKLTIKMKEKLIIIQTKNKTFYPNLLFYTI